MAKPRSDMLPDTSKTSGPPVPEEYQPKGETGASVVESKTEPAPNPVPPPVLQQTERAAVPKGNTESEGAPQESRTEVDEPPREVPKGHVPLSALQEERKRRKEAEARIKQLESVSAPSEYESDEEDELAPQERSSVRQEIKQLREERELDRLLDQEEFESLQDHLAEFDEYRQEHSSISVTEAAKLFMFDKGLTYSQPMGAEAPSKGPKTTPKTQYSSDELKVLREQNPRQYQRLVRSGALRDVKW